MSVTIVKNPATLQPIYNPILIIATSSNQTLPNYQMNLSLYNDGDKIVNLKSPVNPEGYLIFDIHRHLESGISFDFEPEQLNIMTASNSITSYTYSISEEFRYEFDFVDNAFTTGGWLGFLGASGGAEPLFNVGDQIVVEQSGNPTNIQYNGTATITGITFSVSLNSWTIIINKQTGVATGPEGGKIYLNNFQLTTIQSGITPVTRYANNAVFDFIDFIDYDLLDFTPSTVTPARWFTRVPESGYELDINDRMGLLSYKRATGQNKELWIESRDISGATKRFKQDNIPYDNSDYNSRLVSSPVGPWNLINGTASWTPVGTASFPIIESSTESYKVWFENNSNLIDTRVMEFKIRRDCSRYEKIQLVFQDALGSFVPFTFNMMNKQTREIERTQYGQNYGKYAPASNEWTYKTSDRGSRVLDTRVKQKFTITSNWVNQATGDILLELMESPNVYWIREDGVTLAINILTSTAERRQVINEQIINYEIDFELSQKSMKQKG